MLDAYCNTLSDEAQLRIALRLAGIALPVWDNYIARKQDTVERINLLVTEKHRIEGASKTLDAAFVGRALEKIHRSYTLAKEKSQQQPIPIMKGDATLSPLLATCMQPLTNARWDETLPESQRLVFTALFNILVWILYRRRNHACETHIYVAINQAADVLLRESLATVENINNILGEYRHERRRETEDDEWDNAFGVGRAAPMQQEDIYRRITGETVPMDQCGRELASEVLRQMRDEGKSYWNSLDEYLSGTSTTYSYDTAEQKFVRQEIDTIVGSFSNTIIMSASEMQHFISLQSVSDLRQSGFEV